MPSKSIKGKYSELRQDIVSGEWVVIATGRAKRPNDFIAKAPKAHINNKDECPFESLEADAELVVTKSGEILENAKDSRARDWFVEVIPNKFPAFSPRSVCAVFYDNGPHRFTDGIGFHEVIVFRPHEKSLALMTSGEVALVIRAYKERMKALNPEECVEYISIIHNHGPLSGASVSHPHSQLIAIPVIPPDVLRSLSGSERYFIEKKECVHCVMIAHELKEKTRLVFENDHFVAFAPYASRAAFETRIFPKLHSAEFQNITDEEINPLAQTLRAVLAKLYHGLGDPSYNFFIHTAPTTSKRGYGHYHWHLEILPKTGVWGGFEFGTGIEISTIAPENAAKFLRGVKVP
ncbi:MAG: DUF4921 family protein [Candidatus Sungbacteria bacterium]|nr:DUF4921 family protein [Candidatus Sungbacteria bacterium]